jgi:hypothetical protein
MTGFELNEKLKEQVVLLGVEYAVTQRFEKDVTGIQEPFYETTLMFPIDATTIKISEIFMIIIGYKNIFDHDYLFIEPIIERIGKKISLVYAIFPLGISFNDKITFKGKLP